MDWKDKYFQELDHAGLFESRAHKQRFKELIDCYSCYPFFTKGLCKCMYLSAWDEEHFFIMLEMMTSLTLGKECDTKEMRKNGDVLANEHDNSEHYIYELSNAFLDERDYTLDDSIVLSPDARYIIEQALKASAIIDANRVGGSD